MLRNRIACSFLLLAGLAHCGSPASIQTGDEAELVALDPALESAALANLKRIAREIDSPHMSNYVTLPSGDDSKFNDSIAKAFLDAVKIEYEAKPELLTKRVKTLASMVFFSAPEVTTDAAIGHMTPFHGMDEEAFEALMTNEDVVFNSHMSANGGSPNGVRPFSVCETKYLIDISTGRVVDPTFVSGNMVSNYDAYAQAYATYAASCPQADLDEWYNFRGLGGLRPSWLESNYNDRVLRRMLKTCKNPTAENKENCASFQEDRLAYRDRKNVSMALREMMWDTDPASTINGVQDGDYMANPNQAGVFVEDQNGDNIAEWVPRGSAQLKPQASFKIDGAFVTVGDDGASIIMADKTVKQVKEASISMQSSGQFSNDLILNLTFADDTTVEAKTGFGAVQPLTRVMAGWDKSFASRADLGLSTLMVDGDCSGDRADPDKCPLIKRFYSLIDRHENFYQTYSTFDPKFSGISSQPSPLVACSITLRASHHWDTAGTPPGGTAGFIYLMRIPFSQILAGDVRSIDTLGRLRGDLKSGPTVINLQDIVHGAAKLDMTKVWLDIATLSNNQYSSEHEVSKFGTVPAEQIEGVLVIRRPAAMNPTTPPAVDVPPADIPANVANADPSVDPNNPTPIIGPTGPTN